MPYFIRSGSLTGFPVVALDAGLDPLSLLREFGVPQRCLDEPDLMMPIEPACRLLEAAATRSGVEGFGLLMAEARKVSSLGPLGMFAREQPTLREAVEAMARYGRLLNESLVIWIEETPDVAVLREELLVGDQVAVRQGTELAVGLLFKLMCSFLGADWKPRRVCFVHEAPHDGTVHQRIFGREVHFGADFNGIVCTPRDLTAANPHADPTIARYAKQLLESQAPAESGRFSSQVRQLVVMQLSSGQCTVDRVAQLLRIDRRTIHRRLLAEGHTFTDVLESVRHELVTRYVADPRTSLAQVSSLLGFAAPSGFSRWYRQRFGEPASAARGRRAREAP
jgi:AraC-type DNA-binding domain-containing proteins